MFLRDTILVYQCNYCAVVVTQHVNGDDSSKRSSWNYQVSKSFMYVHMYNYVCAV